MYFFNKLWQVLEHSRSQLDAVSQMLGSTFSINGPDLGASNVTQVMFERCLVRDCYVQSSRNPHYTFSDCNLLSGVPRRVNHEQPIFHTPLQPQRGRRMCLTPKVCADKHILQLSCLSCAVFGLTAISVHVEHASKWWFWQHHDSLPDLDVGVVWNMTSTIDAARTKSKCKRYFAAFGNAENVVAWAPPQAA